MEELVQPASRGELPRREVMQTPEAVAATLRLKVFGGSLPITAVVSEQPEFFNSIHEFCTRRGAAYDTKPTLNGAVSAFGQKGDTSACVHIDGERLRHH